MVIALAIATMKHRKIWKIDFKKYHPSGSLGAKLKTVEDLMITGIQNSIYKIKIYYMKKALKVMRKSNIGVLISSQK